MAEVNQQHAELIKQLRGIRRIVINIQYGGFGLSYKAKLLYLELAGIKYTLESQTDRDTQIRLGNKVIVNGSEFTGRHIARDDPALVNTVYQLGSDSSTEYATLKVVEIPSDVEWQIEEYDGREWVAEKHRTWR
ncbi:MAG: hypothetical protein EB127_07255 [Alphaproteobacteria bacterium]|nr:hypothetical protein [Alphaproteobacteria bacterium]